MPIFVQAHDFDLAQQTKRLDQNGIGALVSFTGIVRQNAADNLKSLELEHYPDMTQAALEQISAEAQARWSITEPLIIHRFGNLGVGEQIMAVVTASAHRTDAFAAAEFLMDYLKSRAPFWKKEHFLDGSSQWVEATQADEDALLRW